MAFAAFCGRALWRALYRALCVHCTCTVQNTVCALLLLEAWRHILCLWVAAVKMNVSLDWGCAPPLHPNCRTLAAHNFQRSSGRGPQSFPDCVSFVFWLPPSYGPPNASLFVTLAFICLPVCLVLPGSPDVSLYLPPFMCLVVCLYKCPALHLPPFTSNGRKPLGFNFQKLGGHRRFSLIRICTRGSGKLEALSPAVSPSIFPLCLPPCLSLCWLPCSPPRLPLCPRHCAPLCLPACFRLRLQLCTPLRFPMRLAMRFASSVSRKFVSV